MVGAFKKCGLDLVTNPVVQAPLKNEPAQMLLRIIFVYKVSDVDFVKFRCSSPVHGADERRITGT